MSEKDIDFDRLARLVRHPHLTDILHCLKRRGVDYSIEKNAIIMRNPHRNDKHKGSFRYIYEGNKEGVWKDFATDDKGGDFISLIAYLDNTSNGKALWALVQELRIDPR